MKKKSFFIIFIFCIFTSMVQGASFQKGMNAYNDGNYTEAIKQWRPLAQQGVSETVFNLGPINAKDMLREQLNAVAQFNLGIMYDMGQGVKKNLVISHYWFNLAAHQLQDATKKNEAVRQRDSIAKKLTPSQLDEAIQRFKDWKPVLSEATEQKFAPFGRGF